MESVPSRSRPLTRKSQGRRLDLDGPAVPHVRLAGGFGDRRAHVKAVDAAAEQTQQRGGQCHGRGSGDDDTEPGRDAEGADEAHAGDAEPAQRHGDRGGGDQHGAAAGGNGPPDRLSGFHPQCSRAR